MIRSTQSTNNFRKCSYCPHQGHNKQSCCKASKLEYSQKQKQSSSAIKKKSKKPLQLKKSKKSSISFINNTLPIFNNNSKYSNLNSNILVENSVLRTQNDYLKKQLHSQYKVSAFMKEDRNQSVNQSYNQTSRTHKLHDKLYYANLNLQQTLFELDNLSKINSNLYLQNIKLEQQKQQLKIKNEQLIQQSARLKKKLKKAHKQIDQLPNEQQIQKLFLINQNLQSEKSSLCQQIQQLKQMLKRTNHNKTNSQIQNLSPQWVANTSTKINVIQKNIQKLQQQNKQNLPYHNSIYSSNQLSKICQDQISGLKKQIISAIKTLKFQTQSFMFGSSTFQEMMNNCNSSTILLIKSLCQALLEPLQNNFVEVFKDIDRKLKNFSNTVAMVMRKMENVIIKVENDKLREKNKKRQQF